jgi:hypothetical protein
VDYHPYWVSEQEELAQQNHGGLSLVNLMVTLHLLQEGSTNQGGDLAVSAFADFSFDLPLKLFTDAGIHGHAFLTAGNVVKLSEGEYKKSSFPEFRNTFRSTAGTGIILPTTLFRVEVHFLSFLKL